MKKYIKQALLIILSIIAIILLVVVLLQPGKDSNTGPVETTGELVPTPVSLVAEGVISELEEKIENEELSDGYINQIKIFIENESIELDYRNKAEGILEEYCFESDMDACQELDT